MSDNNLDSEQAVSTPTSDDAQRLSLGSKGKQKKNPPFDLAEIVLQHAQLMQIDDRLYLYDPDINSYGTHILIPINQQELEKYILNKYYDLIGQTYPFSSVKTCASILLYGQFNRFLSAEHRGILCLNNGYISLRRDSGLNYSIPHMSHSLNMISESHHLETAPDLQSENSHSERDSVQYYFDIHAYNPRLPEPYNTYCINANIPRLESYTPAFMKNIHVYHMDAFLQQVTGGSSVATQRIWEMLGCLLTPTCGKFFFLLQGVPDSGKSLLGNLIRSFYPADQIANLDIVQLGKSHAASSLEHKRINMCMDLPNQALPATAVRTIKLVSGGDEIAIMDAHNQFHSSTVTCSFLFASNHPLVLKGRDDAFIKRIVCIKFNNSIPLEKQDPTLLDSLIAEKDMILMKALGHYVDLFRNHFRFAGYDSVQFSPQIEYTQGRVSEDIAHIQEFVESECEFAAKDQYRTLTQELFMAYEIYCTQKGYVPVNGVAIFSKHLNTLYKSQIEKCKWHIEKSGPSLNGFKGILLHNRAITQDDSNDLDYD